jgi:hypothetical protein
LFKYLVKKLKKNSYNNFLEAGMLAGCLLCSLEASLLFVLLCQVEARSIQTGEVLYRDTLGAPLAAVLSADLRHRGAQELVAASVEGEVQGSGQAVEELLALIWQWTRIHLCHVNKRAG